MEKTSTWLVPVDAGATVLQEVETVLIAHRLAHQLLDPDEIMTQPATGLADIAVLLGGPLQPSMLEALRHLVTLHVPALVIVEGLTDHHESLLLGAGAFDVVGLPTSQGRLTSRLIAIHRNAAPRAEPEPLPRDPETLTSEQHSSSSDLKLYPERRMAWVHETALDLTKNEFDLLVVLAHRPQDVLSRHELNSCVSGRPLGARTLESHLSRIRQKLVAAGAPRLIEPVRGVGYRLGDVRVFVETPTS